MTATLFFSLLGSAGFLLGVAGLLQFWNVRKPTKEKTSADAYTTWRTFMAGAVDDRDREHDRVVTSRDQLYLIRETLIEIAQDTLAFAKSKGVPHTELEPFYDRLDEARKL